MRSGLVAIVSKEVVTEKQRKSLFKSSERLKCKDEFDLILYPHLWLTCALGVGLTGLPTPVIHDFCLPPRSVFSVVFEEAISCPVKASPAGGLVRIFERGVHRNQEDSGRCP